MRDCERYLVDPYRFLPLEDEDLEWFLAVRNASRESLHDDREFGGASAREWFTTNKSSYLGIHTQDSLIGYFRLGDVEVRQGKRLQWIGADIDPRHRRNGHAFDSYRQLMDSTVRDGRADGFILRVLPANLPAQMLYRKLGFVTTWIQTALVQEQRGLLVSDIEMVSLPDMQPIDLIQLVHAGWR